MASNVDKYHDTVSYLYSLQKHGIKLGLENITKLMGILGEPQRAFHSVHIAGTNGKGSTSTAIASILRENGFKVGLFTSPHLVSFTERMRINDQRIDECDVISIASLIRESVSGTDMKPTFFEVVTAMAFYYFARERVEWAVVETGMGGRLDATNIITPEISVITSISLDHCEFLGQSISDITFEKAGIIKPGVPVITSSDAKEVLDQLNEIAGERGCDIHVYGKDFTGSLLQMDERKILFDYSGHEKYQDLNIPLTGEYQLRNACTAVRSCEILRKKGFPISDNAVRQGLLKVRIEGRLERVSEAPPVFVDGAHNPEAAQALADTVTVIFPGRKILLIAGVMNDKDIKGILYPLVKIASLVILTRPGYERAAIPEKLKATVLSGAASGADEVPVMTTDTVAEALELAKRHCGKDNIILVTGSFYTIGEVKEVLGGRGVLSSLREGYTVSEK